MGGDAASKFFDGNVKVYHLLSLKKNESAGGKLRYFNTQVGWAVIQL